MAPKIIDRDEKRKRIGSVALKHFARDGFSASSMAQIAKTAGVGKGTMYEYFRSKEDLISFSLTLYVDKIEQNVAFLIGDIPDPKDRLRYYVIEVIKAIKNDPHTMGVLLAIFKKLITDNNDRKPADLLNGMFQSARTAICDMIIEGADKGIFRPEAKQSAPTIASNIIAYIDGLWLHSLVNPKAFNIEDQAHDYLNRLFYSLDQES